LEDDFNKESAKLRKAISELAALNRIASAINSLMAVDEITRIIVDRCLEKLGASQGAVFLIKDRVEQIDKFKTFIREFSQSAERTPFHLNESLLGWMIKNKTIFVSNNPDSDNRLGAIDMATLGIKSIMAAPLTSKGGLIGTLVMFNKNDPAGFNEDDKRFLGIVGSQTANVIEMARLREQENKLFDIEEDIKVARSIQKRFLPEEGVFLASCEAYGDNIPARGVCGDYYDIVALGEERIFISIGDVSGKGIPASILMANAQAVLRAQLQEIGTIPLARMATSLNHLIYQFTGPEQFITALFGLYDGATGSFRYINAGHEPPHIVRRNGSIEIPSDSDLIIGVSPDYDYTVREVNLTGGELLFLYTDGITEALDESGQCFGAERLRGLLGSCLGLNVREILKRVVTALTDFRGAAIQTDDITALILRAM
jgi:sigma-B regulation protein RsbU (phosphoserine phosphatase)